MPKPTLPPEPYRLAPTEAAALKGAVQEALKETSQALEPWNELFSDMYSGRDPSTGIGLAPVIASPIPDEIGLSYSSAGFDETFSGSTSPAEIAIPQVAANLILSRLRQRVIATTPGVPRIATTPLIDGAVRASEDQAALFDALLPSSNIEEVMSRIAFLLPTQSFAGVKLLVNPEAEAPTHRFAFEAIESSHCGFEPFLKRFTWHTYSVQYGELPDSFKDALIDEAHEEEIDPWQLVGVTEVYHPAFKFDSDRHVAGQVPASVYVRLEGDVWHKRRVNPELGEYVHTQILRGPILALAAGLDPAPNESVPMPEVLSWLPLMRSISVVLRMMVAEVEKSNTINVYDKEAIGVAIRAVANARPGQTVYLPVDVEDGSTQGVNSRLRPVERNSILSELIAVLNTLLALFDDVTGVGPLDRGAAVSPEKSATEASALVQASGRRNTDAIRTQARLWSRVATMFMVHQRDILGPELSIPQSGGLTRKLKVPAPDIAPMNLRVDPIAFENQGRQGRIDTEMLVLTTLTNTAASLQNPNAMRMVNEALRRFLKAVGWKDADDFMDTAADPLARYVDFLETGVNIPVLQDDNHAAFISGYGKILERAKAAGREVDVAAVQDALMRHQTLFKEASQGTTLSPVPGVSAQGGLDNQVAAAAASGAIAAQTRQTLGG